MFPGDVWDSWLEKRDIGHRSFGKPEHTTPEPSGGGPEIRIERRDVAGEPERLAPKRLPRLWK